VVLRIHQIPRSRHTWRSDVLSPLAQIRYKTLR